jgi:hypothetical protein
MPETIAVLISSISRSLRYGSGNMPSASAGAMSSSAAFACCSGLRPRAGNSSNWVQRRRIPGASRTVMRVIQARKLEPSSELGEVRVSLLNGVLHLALSRRIG